MKVKEDKAAKVTPLMKQYNSIKGKYPDALLLFRVGDFYETFGEDAVRTSEILGIVLTKRANGSASFIELAGFPYHSLDTYLPKLVRAGQRVAICEQLEDPKTTKNIVKRGVTELVTPGLAAGEKMLDHKSNNFLAVVYFEDEKAGIALLDYSTGEFSAAEGRKSYIDKLLQSFNPSEVVFCKSQKKPFTDLTGDRFYSYGIDEWVFSEEFSNELLINQFDTNSLKGFGIAQMKLAVIAAGAALHYLSETNNEHLQHISNISRIDENQHIWLDRFSIRNLELIDSPHDQAKTLFDVMDQTLSPMGARLLKKWIIFPLIDIQKIEERHNLVEHFIKYEDLADQFRNHIKQCGDLERIISKVAMRRVSPRELVQLRRSLEQVAPVKEIGEKSELPALNMLADQLNRCDILIKLISDSIHDDPPAVLSKGSVIKSGYSDELDELRSIAYSGKDSLLKIQAREIERTGIPSLKVSFNNVFGYYIEVTNTHKNKVPADWVRKQTLVNAERYITSELKTYEEKILGAETKIRELEEVLYNELVASMSDYIVPVQQNALIFARIDCLLAFATNAVRYNYIRPVVNDDKAINIKDGRHPVLERQMLPGESYVPNDLCLDNEGQQIMMITGPNMSGKSALLRQTALIVLMAQTGSFVPASSADIGFVDKIFTRVGASDNISSGESTFMVEMNETASILNNISDRSLILLDEIGRGTSTYDGISIAWAIAEFLHEHPKAKAKTLFATHYHELNEMEARFKRIRNFNVSIKESGKKILFLRKLVPGGSEHSFGIHVAKMAGMPNSLIQKAAEMLKALEKAHGSDALGSVKPKIPDAENVQLSFFKLDDPLLEKIRDEIMSTDINTLTPVEALMKLNHIKELISKKK